MKKIAILGSTGSIGSQALEVIRQNPERFSVVGLSSHANANLLIEQAKEFKPAMVHITDEKIAKEVRTALKDTSTKVLTGAKELKSLATDSDVDMVISAIVGFAGLKPTLAAIEAGKDIALANKETLVVAGDIVMDLATKKEINILPVDSEHSAIFQAMQGENYDKVRRMILTASGGPFLDMDVKDMYRVSCEDALKHPNWNMGNKITIDSATMMNKGLEVIEAYHLFKTPPFKIEVVIHPQSIIHSMVEFDDRSIKAQMGLPDMRVPIQYALGYPERLKNKLPELDFTEYNALTFQKPDLEKFPALGIAFETIRRGGNFLCIFNAANEIAVDAFLNNEIGFMEIARVVEQTMEAATPCVNPDLDDLVQTDNEAREKAKEFIIQLKK